MGKPRGRGPTEGVAWLAHRSLLPEHSSQHVFSVHDGMTDHQLSRCTGKVEAVLVGRSRVLTFHAVCQQTSCACVRRGTEPVPPRSWLAVDSGGG